MTRIVEPLQDAGVQGLAMASGDGVFRRAHPIFALFIGDYPEQILMSALKTGDCPTCPVPRDERGNIEPRYDCRDMDPILDAFGKADDPDPYVFTKACADAGVKPIYHPFWQNLPYVHIYRSIAPDILHQLYQGVIKHLFTWIKATYGSVEIDARCRRLPPNHNIRLFTKGVCSLSQLSGQEHSQICCILLGLVVDLRLPDNQSSARLIRVVRALLDFLYLAQYPLHSTETLQYLEDALKRFHDNKHILVDLGIREHFNINKLHFLLHYQTAITLYGTTDNYNTEYTERLHIDLAKDAYRATNRKDEFTQMTMWLERKEKMMRHKKFIAWRLAGHPAPTEWHPPVPQYHCHLQMMKYPTRKRISLDELKNEYGATFFHNAFTRYFVALNNPTMGNAQVERAAANFHLPFQTVAVYHKIKFWNRDERGYTGKPDILDSAHVKPARADYRGRVIPGRFDTVLVKEDENFIGVKGVDHIYFFLYLYGLHSNF